MTNDSTVTVRFRATPPQGKLVAMLIPMVIVGVGGSLLIIHQTLETENDILGLGSACGLMLVATCLFAWGVYSSMIPHDLIAGSNGLTIINRKSGAERRAEWLDVTYRFIEDEGEEVMYVQTTGQEFVVDQRPKYCSSPPTYLLFREVLVERAKPHQRA